MSEKSAAAPRRPWPLFQSFAGWRFGDLGADAVAGVTLAAIAIPEQMATARLAGFEAQIGFLALVAGAVGFAVFGASRLLSVGADSTIAPIFAGALALLATSGLAALRRRRGVARARRRPDSRARRRLSPRLRRRPAFHPGHHRVPGGNRRPHPRQPSAGAARPRGAARGLWSRRSPRSPRGSARRISPLSASASACSRSCWRANASIRAFPAR